MSSLDVTEDFLTLYADPGEDFGWCVGKGLDLLAAGTTKMWTMADFIWEKLNDPEGQPFADFDDGSGFEPNPLSSHHYVRSGVDGALMKLPIQRIVCEDFRIYPKEAMAGQLNWDRVRTARVIGAMTMMCRLFNIPFILQPASIKPAAQACGVEELYYTPLYPNRHQNDAIQHFVFYTNVELMGLPLSDGANGQGDESEAEREEREGYTRQDRYV